MGAFLVGGPMLSLAYFKTFSNALAYWNYLTLGEGITELQNLGIDPEDVHMYELKFVEDLNPQLIQNVDLSNQRTRERRANGLQKSFDEVFNRVSEESGNECETLGKATPDRATAPETDLGRTPPDVEGQVQHDPRADHRASDTEYKASGHT